ncbi:winged helix-turn-helix transcriptional regulator [Azoarcus sp. L1K30]|uniref:ArsR/SmtB family transcription factor n=1 Tax=Azoarcus sp. L1K30 TaxID=2820277 RepID=UPI001B82EF58|nr:metalloregulator ArsR/SmtB family transcription factor [Azoarcus sp. L1K30]MBR0565549.1 winged helix-turn-helix transcriptional regulator [Azoarcus sp. L1K30]
MSSRPTPHTTDVSALDAEALAQMCKALGHPVRVRILQHLAAIGECYFGELSDLLPQAPSTISQHMSMLKAAGLVLGESEEQRTCYCVNPARMHQLRQLIDGLAERACC